MTAVLANRVAANRLIATPVQGPGRHRQPPSPRPRG
jgi:hypothetical protein